MLERAHELLEHRAVQLDLRTLNLEVGALVELLRGLPHDAVEPLRQASERHGADREQLLLDIARQAGLREQGRVCVVDVAQQRLLYRRDVVDAFGKAARQLLESCEAIELERVEFLLAWLEL